VDSWARGWTAGRGGGQLGEEGEGADSWVRGARGVRGSGGATVHTWVREWGGPERAEGVRGPHWVRVCLVLAL
jgi:hypothetical protein